MPTHINLHELTLGNQQFQRNPVTQVDGHAVLPREFAFERVQPQ